MKPDLRRVTLYAQAMMLTPVCHPVQQTPNSPLSVRRRLGPVNKFVGEARGLGIAPVCQAGGQYAQAGRTTHLDVDDIPGAGRQAPIDTVDRDAEPIFEIDRQTR
ncbi:hypothetical protein D3C80_822450 [compost metagenome]